MSQECVCKTKCYHRFGGAVRFRIYNPGDLVIVPDGEKIPRHFDVIRQVAAPTNEQSEADQNDFTKMTKPQLVQYAKEKFDADLDVTKKRPALMQTIKALEQSVGATAVDLTDADEQEDSPEDSEI